MRHVFQAAFASVCLVCIAPAAMARDLDAAAKAKIDTSVDAALSNLYASVPGSQDVTSRAAAVLVFPSIAKAGFIVGGQHGDGALRVAGRTTGYYSTGGMSFGLQAGAEQHSMAMAFMTQDALQRFQANNGWDVGADAQVAIVKTGGGGKLEASQVEKPIQVFVYGNKGLMGSVALEGTKISKVG